MICPGKWESSVCTGCEYVELCLALSQDINEVIDEGTFDASTAPTFLKGVIVMEWEHSEGSEDMDIYNVDDCFGRWRADCPKDPLSGCPVLKECREIAEDCVIVTEET